MADDRTYIRVHDGMPGHPKVRGVSDKAFRTLIRAWCYCSEYLTDGEVVSAVARDLGTNKAWAELVSAGLAELAPGGYWMHDYLEHQRSAAEVAEIKAGRGAGGTLGNHVRWHVTRRINDPKCKHCNPDEGIANGSQERWDSESDGISQGNRSRSHSQRERERELSSKTSVGGITEVDASDARPPLYSDRCSRHGNVLEPGNCGDCADVRKANAAQAQALPDYRLRVVKPLCGECDDRWIDTPTGLAHCPRCSPAVAS